MNWADIVFPSAIVCGLFGIILAVGVGFSYLWLVWLNKQATKCPECGKPGAGELVEGKLIDSRSHWERKTQGNIFHRDESPVQVTKETYEDHFECQYCGHQWTRTAQLTKTIPKKRDKNSPDQRRKGRNLL